MLNGLEKTLERKVPERDRRWQVAEETWEYQSDGTSPQLALLALNASGSADADAIPALLP